MAVYSYAQMEELWIRAGGPRALAPIAAAIGEAESGGNSDAVNPVDNGGTQSSFGLWQISTGTHTPPSPDWANPAVNAQLAVGKWQGASGFTPWGTYDSGAYRAFLSNSTTPDPNVPGNPGQQVAQLTAATSADCAIGFGGVQPLNFLGLGFFNFGPTVGKFCVLSKSNVRAIYAVMVLTAGGVVTIAGLGFIAVFAMRYRPAQVIVQPAITVTRDIYRAGRNKPAPAKAPVKQTGAGP